MTVHYLPQEPTMHTNEWPARRPYIPLGCDQQGHLIDGQRVPAPAECSTEVGADMPTSRKEACSPMIGVIVGSAMGALAVALFVWLAATVVRVA